MPDDRVTWLFPSDGTGRRGPLRSRFAHDNPHWPVSSRKNAIRALDLHCDCDYSTCSTFVAAVIVSRDNFRYFRDRAPETP
ncbi:hypothetical protein IU486_01900 [Streptomyces gardneri]|uniref:hypothetical protein n=1 Tax=Nocardia TaxID=1817 RepID=UPI00135C8019|nr:MULTISPECIES: hypothetical protein [Nocardia]MBF6163525.1 hypothetical protein [Streptomyces gardneri]